MCEHDVLLQQIKEVKDCSEENHRTLRGHDGEVGLVAKVDAIDTSIANLKTNDLPHMEERLTLAIKTQAEKNVTWPALAKGLVQPVTIAVIISVVITLIGKFFF